MTIDLLKTALYAALVCVTVTLALAVRKSGEDYGGVAFGLLLVGWLLLVPACVIIAELDEASTLVEAIFAVFVVGGLLYVPVRIVLGLWGDGSPSVRTSTYSTSQQTNPDLTRTVEALAKEKGIDPQVIIPAIEDNVRIVCSWCGKVIQPGYETVMYNRLGRKSAKHARHGDIRQRPRCERNREPNPRRESAH